MIEHPKHGPLTVHERIGRSRRCVKQDGTEVVISSKELNKLTGGVETVQTPDGLITSVRVQLAAMPDTSERVRVAREIWALADTYLQS
jgi:hypothetical protein